jgi:hypothetical protein
MDEPGIYLIINPNPLRRGYNREGNWFKNRPFDSLRAKLTICDFRRCL